HRLGGAGGDRGPPPSRRGLPPARGRGLPGHGGPAPRRLSGPGRAVLAPPGPDTLKAGLIDAPIPLSATVFTAQNLALMAAVTLGLPLFVSFLHPTADRVAKSPPPAL